MSHVIDFEGLYTVIKINDGQRVYFQVRKENIIYPPSPKNAVVTCMAYGIQTAQAAIRLRDKLTSQLEGKRQRNEIS